MKFRNEYESFGPKPDEKRTENIPKEILELKIELLDLDTRYYNILKACNIDTLNDLIQYSPSELIKFRDPTERCLKNIQEQLKNKFNIIWEEDSVKIEE